MMGYFDFFLTFTDKNSCFEINIDEFWWKCEHIWVLSKAHKHWHWYLRFSIYAVDQLYILSIRILFNDWKLNFEEKTDIKDGTGVSQDGKIYRIYIPSYCSFSVRWSICWPKYYKN